MFRTCGSSVQFPEAMPVLSSDLDLLVDFDDDASLLDQVGLAQDLEHLLGVTVDVVSSGGLRPYHEVTRQEAVEL